MATIRCESCGRYIQDYDKQCLYCNAPNKEYKAPLGDSFGSFGSSSFGNSSFGGSSLGGPSFGSSFGTFGESISSSFDTSTPTDFGVGKDFVDVEPTKKPLYADEYHEETRSSVGKMSSFFEAPVIEDEELDEEPIILTKPVSKPRVSYSQPATSYPQSSEDYRKKLDNYRKANGFGEYAPVSSKQKEEKYQPPYTSFGGKPIDEVDPVTPTDYSYQRTSHNKKKKKTTPGTILFIIFLFYFGQTLLSILFSILSMFF